MNDQKKLKRLGFGGMITLIFGAVAAFTLAYSTSWGGIFILVFLWCLLTLARLGSARIAFYSGLAIGMVAYSIQLWFFYSIFGPAAAICWLALAFWLGIFVLLAHLCSVYLKPIPAALAIPFIWMALEYFRSELYYLRFSWLNVGYILPAFAFLGMYGVGFIAMTVAALWSFRREVLPLIIIFAILLIAAALILPALAKGNSPRRVSVPVAGVQFEFEHTDKIFAGLDEILAKYPETKLLVLSEYTLGGPPLDEMKTWCRDHQRFLVVGGEDSATNGNYYDTAFVISTNGEVVFKQGKCVPIQFFKDGLPAPNQKVWESPWGKIGFCICYDLSYTRVTDELVRLGAQAIVVPTMDLINWGPHQHELHSLVAPVRAREYGIPIFRVASSGISQLVDSDGTVEATAPFPGEGAIIHGNLVLHAPGRLPPDRVLALFSLGVTVGVLIWLAAIHRKARTRLTPKPAE